jgi:NAD(P)H-dependent FMN reductase
MSDNSLRVLAVVGSLHSASVTRTVVNHIAARLTADGCAVDVLDLDNEPLPLYDPDSAEGQPGFAALKARVDRADVFILGTPDYHGSISSALKNFLDYFWREFAGKLFATVVASHEKGLTVTDQLRTVARQCYAWTLPYGVSVTEDVDVRGDRIVNDKVNQRLEMLIRDARVYGQLLARQRRADLAGTEPGFMARHRE